MEETRAAAESSQRLHAPDRRSLMLVASAALQWLLILVCLVYLAVLYKSHQEVAPTRKVYVIMESKDLISTTPNCTKIRLETIGGNMNVKDGSIVITSRGFYLVYLEGATNVNETGNIEFHFKHQGNDNEQTWKEYVQNDSIRATLLKELYYDSEVYLTTCTPIFNWLHLIIYPV